MSIPTASKVVNYAKKYVRSAKYGSPNKFTKWYGFGGQAVPWCAIFVYYCLCQTGGKTLMAGCSNKAYCPTIWNWAKKKGYTKPSSATAKKGDLVLFDWEKDGVCDHIGFIIKDNGNGTVQTVEGNTSNTNNGNGGCVQIRERSKSLIKGYVRLPYAKAKKSAKKGKRYSGAFPKLPKRGYFKKGDKGTEVKKLQKFLNWFGNYKLKIDGEIGTLTESAIKKFQKSKPTQLKADGLFGKKSLAKAKSIKK